MSRNGSGVYSPPSPEYPAVAGTLIQSAYFNTIISDLATALTLSVAANGETTITANIPMSGFKITGLGAGTARTDAASLATVQDEKGIYVGTVAGTADVITLTPSPAITAYAAGQRFNFIASGANTTNVTVNVSSLGAKAVTKRGTTALVAADIESGALVTIVYDGTRFQLLSSIGDVARVSANETISGSWTYTASFIISTTAPSVVYDETDQAADEVRWRTIVQTKQFAIQALLDDNTARSAIIVQRGTANAITEINLGNTTDSTAVTMNVDGVNRNVGWREVPQNVQNGNYTLVLTDNGKSIDKQSGASGETITIPANASVAFPIGTVICGDNDGGGTLTIAITSDTLEDSSGSTGNRTVADNGQWVIRKIATTKWRITGSGIS